MRVRARKRGRTGKEIVAALREPVSLKHRTMNKKNLTRVLSHTYRGEQEKRGGEVEGTVSN